MPPFPLPKVYEDPRWNHEWSNRPSGASWVPGAGWTNIPRRRVLKEVVPSLVDQQPRAPPLPRMDGAMEQKGRDTDVAVTLLSPSARDAAEHLRQTTQQRQRWSSGRGHQPGTRVHGSFSIRISCLWSLPPPPPIVSFMVFLFFFFKKDHAVWVFIIHIGEDIWGCFPMEIHIYYIYIYIYLFFANLTKCRSPAGQEREYLQKGSGSLLTLPRGSGLFLLLLGLGWKKEGKKKKRCSYKRWSEKESCLLSLAPFPSWPPLLPPHCLLNFRCPFSRVQPLGESWEFSTPIHWNRWSGCFAAGTTKIKPTSQHLAPCQREAKGPRDAAVLWKDTCEPSRPPRSAVRTVRLGGSPEHKAVQIIWKPQHHGIRLQVLQSKKKKKKRQALWSRN